MVPRLPPRSRSCGLGDQGSPTQGRAKSAFLRRSGAFNVGGGPFHVDLGDPRPDCGAWHGMKPLTSWGSPVGPRSRNLLRGLAFAAMFAFASAQGAQSAPNEAQLRQEFERFLSERKQAPTEPQDRETLFGEFKKLIESMNAQANGSTRRVEICRALETTNLRELASAASTVIGEVAKGSAFRVIGRSDDGKWLKIETPDGLTGYYWAVRAREMR